MMSQLPLDLGHRTALGGADFHVSASNREAVAWLDRWPDWPAGGLAVHGPPGSGKTHLAHVWVDRAEAHLIGPADLAGLDPHRVAAAGPVAIDALGEAPLDAEAERRLLHLYNALVASGGTLLLLGRRPPARWPLSLADLRSRLVALPTVAVAMPDDELFGAVLAKLFADRQLTVGPEVLRYLGARIERSFESARDVVGRLDRAALAARRPVSLPLARQLLGDDDEG
jgi:chromosomal replication initiation ATPase DnaA